MPVPGARQLAAALLSIRLEGIENFLSADWWILHRPIANLFEYHIDFTHAHIFADSTARRKRILAAIFEELLGSS
jgi:hypothetical protein